MSLFNNLLSLHSKKPTEDFFTEIISYFFNKNKPILMHWLKVNNVIKKQNTGNELHISTQISYEALENHSRGSRPDILIEITFESGKEIFFIESKVGSSENEGQLKNYADILASFKDVNKAHLIYITRDYEPKNDLEIIDSKNRSRIIFHQLRWHNLYLFLFKEYINTPLTQEILTFMKEKNMHQNNMFSPLDLLAISNFKRVLGIMDETLKNEVKDKFTSIFNSCSQDSSSLTQYKKHNRYIIYKSGYFWCGVGYFNIDQGSIDELPDIGIIVEVSPKFNQRSEVIRAMTEICKNRSETWTSSNLGNSEAWSNITRTKSMQQILSEPDHALAIKNYFVECLEEVELLKEEYNHLSW